MSKENLSSQSELLKSTKELNDTIRDILDNGTIEQKVDLLLSDYKQRMVNEEFRIKQEIQCSTVSVLSNYNVPRF